MSGFEIAGVVLGALPLVLYAFEHYSDGLAIMRNMQDYEAGFRELHSSFEMSWTLYRHTCEQLLLPLAIPRQDFDELINAPDSDKWRDPFLHEKLKIRLGSAYEPYRNATTELYKKVDKLRRKLKLNDDYLPKWVTLVGGRREVNEGERIKFFRSRWTRILGGFDFEGCLKHIERIRRDIGSLRSLVEDTSKLEAPRRSRQQKENARYWISVRDHAQLIHQQFETFWAQPCRCQRPHCASIHMDRRLGHWSSTQPELHCRFIISFDESHGNSATQNSQWRWRDVEIKSEEISKLVATRGSSTTTGYTTTSTSVPPIHITRPMSALTITKTIPSSLASIAVNVGSLTSLRTPASHSGPKIVDFCETLENMSSKSDILGFLEDQRWRHHVFRSPKCTELSCAKTLVSLRTILEHSSRNIVSPREKQALALQMAMIVLQLHGTPWLDSTFHTKDLVFHTEKAVDAASLLEPPFISRSFTRNGLSPPESIMSVGRQVSRNTLVFALGVMLLELSYGKPLLGCAIPDEIGTNGEELSTTELMVAQRLVKDIGDRESKNYSWATASCIHCDVGEPRQSSLDEEGFRTGFIKCVIEPLEDDYTLLFA